MYNQARIAIGLLLASIVAYFVAHKLVGPLTADLISFATLLVGATAITVKKFTWQNWLLIGIAIFLFAIAVVFATSKEMLLALLAFAFVMMVDQFADAGTKFGTKLLWSRVVTFTATAGWLMSGVKMGFVTIAAVLILMMLAYFGKRQPQFFASKA